MLKAKNIGILAWEAIEGRWKAEVIGVTSGGVFLRVNNERVIFLTYSPFHSPLTVNLEWDRTVDLQENQVGAQAFLDPYRISIPDTRLGIWLQGAQVWQPGFPAGELDRKAAGERLVRVGLAAALQKGDQGFGPFLPQLLAGGPARAAGDLTPELLAALDAAQQAACRQDFEQVSTCARSWIGFGRGLTPAGDDCLAGVLLVVNRWGTALGLKPDLARFNTALIGLARERTTLLSSTIIQAAALGQADERILTILDGILCGSADEEKAIRDLVKMGHSSGVDTLTGMALILSGTLLRTCAQAPGGTPQAVQPPGRT